MKITYAAVVRKDKEDPRWWNISIPDVWGAVTCAESFLRIPLMAEDLLKTMAECSIRAFGAPTPINETKENFPNDIVLPIQVELPEIKDFGKFFKKKDRLDEKIFTKIGGKTYEVFGSIADYRISKVFLVDDNHQRISEVTDKDQKYFILQIARNDVFENLINKSEI